MAGVIVSFLAVIAIPITVILVVAIIGTAFLRMPWPATRKLLVDIAVSVAITIGITLAICLVLSWTGFLQSQFYRPSTHDFGQQKELGIEPEDVEFTGQDGRRLHGWFIPASKNAKGTVIHFHGSDRNISFTIRNCHWLREQGFNVFLFDYRGFGKSAGEPHRQGLIEDGAAAIEYVRSRPEVDKDRICLWGQSMGGQVAIASAELAGKEGIRAIVSEATYASHSHHIKDKMAHLGPLWLVQWGAWLVTSDAFAAEDVVGKLAPTPLLLIHGTEDRGVQPYHSERLFVLAGEPKEIWRVEGGKHLDAMRSERYRAKFVEYLTQACDSMQSSDQNAVIDGTPARLSTE
jgi:fermentation-respiration switch protein FrsA (DUF1100 family)